MTGADTGAPMITDPRMGIQKPSKGVNILIINASNVIVAKMTVLHNFKNLKIKMGYLPD